MMVSVMCCQGMMLILYMRGLASYDRRGSNDEESHFLGSSAHNPGRYTNEVYLHGHASRELPFHAAVSKQ